MIPVVPSLFPVRYEQCVKAASSSHCSRPATWEQYGSRTSCSIPMTRNSENTGNVAKNQELGEIMGRELVWEHGELHPSVDTNSA